MNLRDALERFDVRTLSKYVGSDTVKYLELLNEKALLKKSILIDLLFRKYDGSFFILKTLWS